MQLLRKQRTAAVIGLIKSLHFVVLPAARVATTFTTGAIPAAAAVT